MRARSDYQLNYRSSSFNQRRAATLHSDKEGREHRNSNSNKVAKKFQNFGLVEFNQFIRFIEVD